MGAESVEMISGGVHRLGYKIVRAENEEINLKMG